MTVDRCAEVLAANKLAKRHETIEWIPVEERLLNTTEIQLVNRGEAFLLARYRDEYVERAGRRIVDTNDLDHDVLSHDQYTHWAIVKGPRR